MGAEQTPRRPQRPARPGGTPLLKIPLPPLPHFRRPPAAEAPERTGDSGAAVLNNLVDEIEREIESHLGHVASDGVLPAYRDVLACAHEQARARR